MGTLAEIFRTGGFWAYLVFGIGLLAVVVPLGAAVLDRVGLRPPSFVWLLPTTGALSVRAVATGVGVGEAMRAVTHVGSSRQVFEMWAKGGEITLGTHGLEIVSDERS